MADLTAEVLDWVWIERPLVNGAGESRPHPDDIRRAEAEGLLARRADRWELTEDGELTWATLQGAIAGAR